MIATFIFQNLKETMTRRFITARNIDHDEFDFVLLFELSMMSFGYHSIAAIDHETRRL